MMPSPARRPLLPAAQPSSLQQTALTQRLLFRRRSHSQPRLGMQRPSAAVASEKGGGRKGTSAAAAVLAAQGQHGSTAAPAPAPVKRRPAVQAKKSSKPAPDYDDATTRRQRLHPRQQ